MLEVPRAVLGAVRSVSDVRCSPTILEGKLAVTSRLGSCYEVTMMKPWCFGQHGAKEATPARSRRERPRRGSDVRGSVKAFLVGG